MKITVKILGKTPVSVNEVASKIKELSLKAGIKFSGPIPLPTKVFEIKTRKNVHGRGTETWETYKMKIHKRIIIIEGDSNLLRNIMRLQLPSDVEIELKVE